MTMTKELFHFAGVDWTDVIASRVQNLTSPNDTNFKEHIFSTQRKNSTETAFNWRLKLEFAQAFQTQTKCAEMMKVYGYKQFKTVQEMKDLQVPSIHEEYGEHLFKAQTQGD